MDYHAQDSGVAEEGMSSKGDLTKDAQHHAKDAAQPWMERLARLGYATEGAVYSLIGLLAAGAAFGTGGRATGQHGALEVVAGSPFGGILLGLISIGFLGYALWRGVQAIADPDREGTDVRALGKRVGYGASAVIYAGLAFSAVGLVFGSASEGGGTPDDWTALLLSWPLGQILVVSVGIAVIGVGLRELYQAYRARFLEYLKLDEMGGRVRKWTERWGRLGIAARGSSSGLSGRSLSAQHSSMIRKRLVALAARCRHLLANHLGPGCWGLWRSGWSPMDYLCSRWRATGT